MTAIAESISETALGQARVFSGHESFALRYGWLPKLYDAIISDPEVFRDIEGAILTLGLGKNMVRALRFWGEAFGIATAEGSNVVPTPMGRRLLDPNSGLDPYLEDPSSLWRLHWMATVHGGLGAWTAAFLDVSDLEVTRARLIESVSNLARAIRGPISPATAAAHVDILVRTYDASADRNAPVLEDTLGSPFQELSLFQMVSPGGAATIQFNRGRKSGLDFKTLAFALADLWKVTAGGSASLSTRSIMFDRVSPGAVFRADEVSLYELLEEICMASKGLVLRDNGIGGIELHCKGGSGPSELERLAWRK